MTQNEQSVTRERLTIPVSICSVCDKDRDPLDVPDTPCRHRSDKHRRLVYVEVVPAAEVERLRDTLQRTKRALLLCRDEVPADVWRGSPEDANAVEEALNDAEDVLGMDGSLRPWEGY